MVFFVWGIIAPASQREPAGAPERIRPGPSATIALSITDIAGIVNIFVQREDKFLKSPYFVQTRLNSINSKFQNTNTLLTLFVATIKLYSDSELNKVRLG